MRYLMILTAAFTGTLGPAIPAPARHAAEAEQVEIKFNPPLDTPQRFRLTRWKTRGGASDTPVSWIEELRFTRSDTGFVLHWRMLWDSLPAAMRAPGVAALTRPFAQDPIAFDLDSDGNVLRVRDWAALQPKMIGIAQDTGRLLGASEKDKMATDAAVAQIVARYRALDAESAPAIILKNIDPALGSGGIAFRVGETRASSNDVAIPLFDTTIKRNGTVTMRAADAGTATLDMVSEIDPDSLRGLMANIAGLAPERRAQLGREIAAIQQLSIVDTNVMTLDRTTGLPTRLENTRVAKVQGEGRTETFLIEWLR